ncbi:uncharacterized protein LOC141678761 [Apium graveolens]|uniref:uncharacterized protein LOC141678761 n=1 Tax=Apium graveolens TaxID=4045 RepID=UPI003D797650
MTQFLRLNFSKTISICISGIIGLTIAHKFLLEPDLSVAVVDADVPCYGATSADASNVTELVSRRDDAVTFLQMQPIPAKCDGCEGFMDLHPLLLVVASEEIRCSDPVQHGRDSSLRDKYEPRVGAVIHSLTAIHFYSLRSHSYVHVLRFRSTVYMVRCSSKLVAIGLATQGYIWMVHKTTGMPKWELATRSRHLWEEFVNTVTHQGLDPLHLLGWKKTGSLLVGKTAEESIVLKQRVHQLSKAGFKAQFLSSTDLLVQEPALELDK